MNKYFEVTTAFFDDGTVTAGITDIATADALPKHKRHSGGQLEIYRDYFPTLNMAKRYISRIIDK